MASVLEPAIRKQKMTAMLGHHRFILAALNAPKGQFPIA